MFPAHLVKEWSEKNVGPIDSYTPGSNMRPWWVCNAGHEWQARISDRCRKDRKATGCPQCVGRHGSEDKLSSYPHLLAEWNKKNVNPIDSYTLGSQYQAWWICSKGHEWQTKIITRTRTTKPSGCPQCAGKRAPDDKLENYLHLVAEWSDKNSKLISEYRPGSIHKAHWICKQGHEWQGRISNRTRKLSECPECRGIRRSDKLNGYPQLVTEWHERNIKPISEYTPGSGYKAWWKCKLDHEWQTSIKNRTYGGTGCPVCNVRGRKRKRDNERNCDDDDNNETKDDETEIEVEKIEGWTWD